MTNLLVPIFADQLSLELTSLVASPQENSTIIMMEVAGEANQAPFHRAKLIFIFSAMRHFAAELQEAGWRVDYVTFDDPANGGDFAHEMARALERHQIDRIHVTEPSIHRLLAEVGHWETTLKRPTHVFADERFIASKHEFKHWAAGRKALRLEYFYREMRRKTNLLMDDGQPAGGAWNFDKENRAPARTNWQATPPLRFEPDTITRAVIDMVRQVFPSRVGASEGFAYAVTRVDALRALDDFVTHRLVDFGQYQDAMRNDDPFMRHSILSPYINTGLLLPMEVCQAVEDAYRANQIPINSAEGFIRQIIGWREYVRGIYWLNMPGYESLNYLDATRELPDFYWTGETELNCLAKSIKQTLATAYAHHIQRLMVTGNFALLIGVDPKAVHHWYLSVYIDAFEWVELPNTLGMSQFGDGGLLGSKPYAASGAYINRMSNYCKTCRYDVKAKTGPTACPFNALYWHFLHRNKDKLGRNQRLSMPYRNLERMPTEQRAALLEQAEGFLDELGGSSAADYL